MRLAVMMMAVGCTTGSEFIEGEEVEQVPQRVVHCYTLHAVDNEVAVAEIDLEQRSQDPFHARFTIPGLTTLNQISTDNLAKVDDTLVVRLLGDGDYPVAALDLATGDARILGAYLNSVGGSQELIASCALGSGTCIFDDLAAFEARTPSERIDGIEADALETHGDRVFGMDWFDLDLRVWDRLGTPQPDLVLEGSAGWNVGMSIADDKLFVLQEGWDTTPPSGYRTLRVYSLADGALVDTMLLDRLPAESLVEGLACEVR